MISVRILPGGKGKQTRDLLKAAFALLDEARRDLLGDGLDLGALARDVGDGAVKLGGDLGDALDGALGKLGLQLEDIGGRGGDGGDRVRERRKADDGGLPHDLGSLRGEKCSGAGRESKEIVGPLKGTSIKLGGLW